MPAALRAGQLALLVSLVVSIAALVPSGAGGARTAPRLSVTPKDSLVDTAVSIRLTGLRPRQRVTLRASQLPVSGRVWVSRAVFRADRRGIVDPARAVSLAGTYRGRERMGLFWSMLPANPRDRGFNPRTVATVRVTALQGLKVIATAQAVRRTQLTAVQTRETTLAEEGFVGRLYEPPSTGLRPGILHLGGSDGGLPSATEPGVLASHGYPTLALAYFGEPGLPRDLSEIPLEYFARALEWLGRQPGVDPARLVLYGYSRGAEAALLLGSVYPGLVQAVAAYAPSSVVNPGFPNGGPSWTLGGRPVPYVGIEEYRIPDPPSYPQAVIPVEKIAGPIFLAAGTADLVWPSAAYANAIVRRLRAHGRSDVTLLEYDRSGHALIAAVPNLPAVTYRGGTRRGDAAARAHAWPRLLRFLAGVASAAVAARPASRG